MKSVARIYRVDRGQISFLRFILEAYEGLAVLTTLDPRRGVVRLSIAPGCEGDIDDLMEALSRTIRIEPARPEAGHS